MRPWKKKTLNDVAEMSGVSVATASRVLSGSPLPALPTRERVWRAAEAIGYVTKTDPRGAMVRRNGRGLARAEVGIILRSTTADVVMKHPYYTRMYLSVEGELRKAECNLNVLKVSEEDDKRLPEMMADMYLRGAIAIDIWNEDMLGRIKEIMPLVLLNSAPARVRASSVMPDEASGVYQSMDCLRGLGHRKIFFLTMEDAKHEPPRNWHGCVRERIYLEYIHRYKEDMQEARCEKVQWDGEQSTRILVREALTRWKEADDLPTAVLCAADSYAFAFIDAAHELDIDIPGRMSLIGADDMEPCEFVRPRLTSTRQPFELMGEEAVRMLLQEVDTGTAPVVRQLFDVSLVHRKSCAPPPA